MRTLTTLLLLMVCSAIYAQKHCASATRTAALIQANPTLLSDIAQMEAETQAWITSHAAAFKNQAVIVVPVVVHIVHAGETQTTNGPNITDAQVYAQLEVLNRDYRRLNQDTLLPGHPFFNLSADVGIEFCLAQRNTDGNSQLGIVRINGQQQFGETDWTLDDIDDILKPATQWNPRHYLNIWVVKITDTGPDAGTLGFAYGSSQAGTDIDGVVIDHRYFGTLGNLPPGLNKGRTTTHEVGHYFNLDHIWGDALCGNDNVSDTPPQEADNFGCPAFPHNANNSCGSGASGEMFMNFMDYTDDDCMQLFTLGQQARMLAAINNRRQSLLNSEGCQGAVGLRAAAGTMQALYPNPATDRVVVPISGSTGETTICILNSAGQQVQNILVQAGTTRVTVNIQTMPSGIYLVKKGSLVQKLLVNH